MATIDPTNPGPPEWDIHGWKLLTIHEDPPLVFAREEFLSWLVEVPELHRADLTARLKSELDDAHFSARLELFVHHYFCSNRWGVQIHPQVAQSSNRPDFFVEKGDFKLFVECRSVLPRPSTARQDQRLRQLADEAGKKLGRTVILHPLSDLPPNIPSRRIRSWVQRQLIPHDSPDLLEFDFWDEHQGCHYGVRAMVPNLDDGGENLTGVHGLMSQVETITNAQQLRSALQEKASKYGILDMPYVIAVSGETKFPLTTKHEIDALFGDRVWNMPRRGPVTVTETRSSNGFFTFLRNNTARYRNVSAVLVYRFKWLDEGHEHRVHVYHNPYAENPVDPQTFPGVAQSVRSGATAMEWINGEPEPY